jgi:hypothetical protein
MMALPAAWMLSDRPSPTANGDIGRNSFHLARIDANRSSGPTIPMAWGPGEAPFGDADDDTDLLRPSWQDTPDETDADRRGAWRLPRKVIRPASSADPECWLSGAGLAGLLIPLCDATDALARLDARRRIWLGRCIG